MGDALASAQICSNVDFHPVGQGLFSSGSIHDSRIGPHGFWWVFDCGTSTRGPHLKQAIQSFTNHYGIHQAGQPRLDLLALSHFDKDHINGVVDLLSKFSVRIILLPYVPLATRLFIAFSEKIGTGRDLINFFINPVAYLTRGEAGLARRVVFVSAGSEAVEPGDEEIFIDDPESNNPWEPDIPLEDPLNVPEYEDVSETLSKGHGTRAFGFLKPGGRIRLRGFWEFLPYNDARLAYLLTKPFLDAVSNSILDLRRAATDPLRQKALDDLELIYDQQFGRSSTRRNQISLFLYSGPSNGGRVFPNTVMRVTPTGAMLPTCKLSITKPGAKVGILFTGDGLLDTAARLKALTNILGSERMKQIGVCQVMHHGASSSWHQGVAGNIDPTFSVFSSDPAHKKFKHPNGPVLRDFWSHGPVQVDKSSGIWIRCQFQ